MQAINIKFINIEKKSGNRNYKVNFVFLITKEQK